MLTVRAGISLEIALQSSQQRHRFSSVGRNPSLVNLPDRGGVQVVPAITPLPPWDEQMRSLKHAHVLHHGTTVQRPREVVAQLTGRARRRSKQIQDLTPS